MPMLISKTYEVVTEESADYGESAENGFIVENDAVSFRDLVETMRGCAECSNSRPQGSTREWLSTYPEQDYTTGEWRTEHLHYSPQNDPKNAKYWRKAMQMSGFIK